MSQSNIKLIAILDKVGRTVLGEFVEETETILKIKNGVVLATFTTPDNRMSIQLHPLIFREFLADKEADVVYDYNKNEIVKTNVDALDFRLQTQYAQIFNKSNLFVPNPTQQNQQAESGPNVIKLFDE